MLPNRPSTRLSTRSLLPSRASGALRDFKASTQHAAPTSVTRVWPRKLLSALQERLPLLHWASSAWDPPLSVSAG